jgi:hypothetical protein
VGYWPLADVVDVILALKRRYTDGYIHFGNGSWRRRCGFVFFMKDMKKVKAKKARQDRAKSADQQAPSSQTADKD